MFRLKTNIILLLLILMGVGLGRGRLSAQPLAPGLQAIKERLGPLPRVYSSSTRQFVVVGHEPGSELGPPSRSKIRQDYMQMEPGLVVVSCEKVKTELLLLFRRQKNDWESLITVYVDGKGDPDMPINVSANYSNRGWQFRLVVPGQMEKRRFVRAIVRALLQEMANRGNHSPRVAEVPLWMQEGIAAHMYSMWGPALALGIGTHVWGLDGPTLVVHRHPLRVFEQDYEDLLEPERRHLELFDPVSFGELQMPAERQLEGYDWETFQACSHVFVTELLKLKQGREMMWNNIGLLANFRNAQLAFMEAFKPVFPSVLAADKWWSVALVDFKLRDDQMHWSEERTLARLRDILHVPVSIRIGTNAVPGLKEMMFQELITETSYGKHRPILLQSISKLVIMQVNSRRDLARILKDYRAAIEGYIRKQDANSAPSASRLHKKDIVEQLDLLDGIRFDFKLIRSPEPDRGVDLDRAEFLVNRKAEATRVLAANTKPIDRLLRAEERRLKAAAEREEKVQQLLLRERERLEDERGRIDRLLAAEGKRLEQKQAAEITTVERILVEERRRLERQRQNIRLLEQEIIRTRTNTGGN